MKNMNLLEFEAPRIENGKLLLIAGKDYESCLAELKRQAEASPGAVALIAR